MASVAFGLLLFSCSKQGDNNIHTNPPVYTPPHVATTFAKGADISWVTQMESTGVKFYDKNGAQQDIFA